MEKRELFPRRGKASAQRRKREIVATYDYADEDGNLLFQAVREKPKRFWQRRPDGKGGWIPNLNGVRRVLYRLPELSASDLSSWVYIVEGEKDANRLRELGWVDTRRRIAEALAAKLKIA